MENNIERPLIGICIPTFNRSEKVCSLVRKILQYEGADIEVVVLDNFSEDDTVIKLKEISDDRFKFYQNEFNIGGPLNQLKVLTLSNAVYSFFCLDKDSLEPTSIYSIIRTLKNNPDAIYGYCELNANNAKSEVIYHSGREALLNMAYKSQHPTGIFYESETYRELPLLKQIFIEKKPFPFYPDLINGEMAMKGGALKLNLPAFYTETPEECKSITSFTYSASNIYFSPENRLKVFDVYCERILSLNLHKADYFDLLAQLYYSTQLSSTIFYKSIMLDENICAHHGIEVKKMSHKELYKTSFEIFRHFLSMQLGISLPRKIVIGIFGLSKTILRISIHR